MSTKTRWAARCWYWNSEAARAEEDGDLAAQQTEQFREAPNKGLAHHAGKRLAAHLLATTPGLYDVMRGVPDRYEIDGVRWEVVEEVRP